MNTLKKAVKYLLEKRREALHREGWNEQDFEEREYIREMIDELEE